MRRFRFPALLSLALCGLAASPKAARDALTAEALLRHTRTLASDEFEGRGPGTPGEDRTVAYLIAEFQRLGLKPGGANGAWTQDVPITGIRSEVALQLTAAGAIEALTFPQDFVAWSPSVEPAVGVADSGLVFVGYGVTAPQYGWDDFKGLDVRGKTLVILVGDPPVPDPARPGELDPQTFEGRAMTYYGRWSYKFEEAARRGAAAALIIHETQPAAYPWFVVINSWGREQFRLTDAAGPALRVAGWLSLERAQRLLEANGTSYAELKAAAVRRDFQPRELRERAGFTARQTTRAVRSRNVLARRDGRDARRRDEWVIYTAHWDHLGRNAGGDGDQIFNGAADNAIGTAGLLELAGAYARAPRAPKRSVLFLAVTAEEQGLLGAKYYAEHPVHPLDRTVANLNMDGLNQWGRTLDVRQVGRGASTLDAVLDAVVKAQGRRVEPDPNPERGTFYRSDHFEFMKQGVPALYLKAGGRYRDRPAAYGEQKVREYIDRDYHKVSDEVKPDWDLGGAVEDLRVLLEVGWRVAEDRAWPKWNAGSEFKAKR
jgi:Zn-dependent M28 family amino/carboxypeptidase